MCAWASPPAPTSRWTPRAIRSRWRQADALLIPFSTPLELSAGGYNRIELDLDLVESLGGDLATPPIGFQPEGSVAISDGSDASELDDVRGLVSEVLGDGFRMAAFVDEDLQLPLGEVQVRVSESSALFDVSGAVFNSAGGLLAALVADSSVVEVKGSLGSSGLLDAQRVEIVDQGAGVGLASTVELEGRVASLGANDLSLLIQEIEQGASLANGVLGGANSAPVSFNANTNILLDGVTPGSSADLAVGQRLKVRFDTFVSAPFPAARIEVQSEPFRGTISDVAGVGGSSSFLLRLNAGEPAIAAGLVTDENTDVTVEFAGADLVLDTAGTPALDPARLLVGLGVQVEGSLTGDPSAPVLGAERVSVRAGRLRGEVVLVDEGARRFTALVGEVQSAFGAGEAPGNVDVFFQDTTVLEGDASLESEFFALFSDVSADEVVNVEVEGLGNGMALQIDAFELEVDRAEIPPPVISIVGSPFDLGLMAVNVEAEDGNGIDEGEEVSFTLTDELAEAKYESFELFFGDGNSQQGTAAQTLVTHSYAQAGTYDVTLVATGPGGESVLLLEDFVRVRLNADFAPSAPQAGDADLLINFSDATAGGTPDSFLWSFGDGTTSTEQNPAKAYTLADTFDVSLTVTGPTGSSTETRSALVDVDVAADFSVDLASAEVPHTVNFTDASLGQPTQFSWDFGDGNVSTQQNPQNIYAVEGVRAVTLTATAASGKSDAAVVLITTQINADFSFTPSVPETTDNVQFNATVAGVDPLFSPTFSWNFDDPGSGVNNTSNLQNPTHQFSTDGLFDVTLTVNGLTDSDTVVMQVGVDPGPPTADFTPNTGDGNVGVGQTTTGVTFTDNSSGSINADPNGYSWTFENGTPSSSNQQNPGTVLFPEGAHDITLVVTGPGGSSAPEVQQISISRTVQLEPEQDTTLYETGDGSLSGGGAQLLHVGETAQVTPTLRERRILIQFDVDSEVPSGANVTDASLTLTQIVAVGNTGGLNLRQVTKAWQAGTVDPQPGQPLAGGDGAGAASADDDVTWIHAQKTEVFWASPGGDTTGTTTTASVAGGILTFSSAAMESQIEGWANSPATNFGWLIQDPSPVTSNARAFASSEHTTTANPVLEITYTP